MRDGQRTITGEASPYYIFHPHAAKRAAATVPEAKIVALLRNPVDRAYSHYWHNVRDGLEVLSLDEAIDAEEQRISEERERLTNDESYYSKIHRSYSYLSRGIYVDQLKNWYAHFGISQVLILESGELFKDPSGTANRVQEFVGLPARALTPNQEKRNEGEYAPMAPKNRQRLKEFFEPHNRRLYEYLGVDLGW